MSLQRIEMFILITLFLFMLLLLFGSLSVHAQVSAEGSFSSLSEAVYSQHLPPLPWNIT